MGQSNRNEEGRMGGWDLGGHSFLAVAFKDIAPGIFFLHRPICMRFVSPLVPPVHSGRFTQPRARATASPPAEISPARKDALAAGGLQ